MHNIKEKHIFDNAMVSGNAEVSGNVMVCDNAMVSGNAEVSGNAMVSGNALIKKSADILIVGPALSSGRYTTAHKDSLIGVRINTGCFSGSLDEFKLAIETTHKDSPQALKQYRSFVRLFEEHFEDTLKQAHSTV